LWHIQIQRFYWMIWLRWSALTEDTGEAISELTVRISWWLP
jgi:hypothetical protein